jgi:ribosomal protein S18 acetylase RimI-like enzyme
MDFAIRNAREKDFDKIISLLYKIAELHSNGRPDLFSGGYSKHTRDELEKIVGSPETPVFVAADKDDNAQGYVFCQLKSSPAHGPLKEIKSLYIDDLCVDENFRGRGIGTALVKFAADFARGNGCFCVDLNVWEFNENAIKFYESMGMRTKKRTMELIL